ncbi:MAG: hypothetical protein JWN85_796 [Gammaproteobacteria bacterium]|nr:hypothetical protein [Gammaproteobacteria bacterium]
MATERRRTRWIRAGLLAICASKTAVAAPTSVTDLLRSLSATGIEVLYSSDLVPPDLEAPAAPRESDLMSRAVAALAAHHLLLRSEGQRRYIVTRAPPSHTEPPRRLPPLQGTALAPNAPRLDEVSVFASRYAFVDSTIGESTSFARRGLEQAPGAQEDALRAMRSAPGVTTNLSSRPYVRGALLDDVLVRFDGIPLTDPFHFKNFQNLISAFDPAAVERIDVYTGGFPVRYGTRSAGVIDVAPRSVESGYEHRVGASLLSYDLSTVGRGEDWPVEWLATARHSTHNLALKPVNGDFGEPAYADALGRVRWRPSPTSAWTLGWLMLDDRVQLSPDSNTEQANVHDRDLYAWAAADWTPTGALHSRTTVSMTSIERIRFGSLALAGVANGSLDERRDFSTVDLRTDWAYMPSATLLWDFGAAATVESADLMFARSEHLNAAIAASFGIPIDNSLTSHQTPRSSTLALFGSGRRRWQDFELEIGARLDRQDYQHFGARAQVSPRVNLRFDPAPVWHLYGSWGYFTQAQRVGEWRSEENQSSPDPATRAVDLIAGVAHESSPATQWRLEAYRKRWSRVNAYFDNLLDKLSLVPELSPDRVRLAPSGAETAGVELSAHRSFGNDIQLSGAYALSHTTDDLYGRDVLRSWDQTHAINMSLAWRHGVTSASLLLGWHTGWPRTPVSVNSVTPTFPADLTIGARNSARWGNYFTADLRLARTVPFSYGALDLWMDATNITRRANHCCIAFVPSDQTGSPLTPGPTNWFSRAVDVGFTWRFGATR